MLSYQENFKPLAFLLNRKVLLKKGGKGLFGILRFVYRFLSSSIIKHTAIATIIAAVEPMRYSPVGSGGGTGVGVGDACGASSTFKYVMAYDGP
jgi:hypothetical protein